MQANWRSRHNPRRRWSKINSTEVGLEKVVINKPYPFRFARTWTYVHEQYTPSPPNLVRNPGS
jgi:hypothetical protein